MNDRDLERRLQDHGAAWRAANHDRPGIDWDAVTGSPRHRRRTWYAVAGAAVAAAAIIVALAVVSGSGDAAKPLPPAVARRGAPSTFATVTQGSVAFAVDGGSVSQHVHRGDAVALAVAANGMTTYAASSLPGCRTALTRVTFKHEGKVGKLPSVAILQKHLPTVSGGRPTATTSTLAPAMAISPDGTKLAMVLVPPNPAHSTSRVHVTACNGAEEIVIVDLVTGEVQRSHAQGADELVGGLTWAPDSRRLAYEITPDCDRTRSLTSCSGLGSLGTHVMDTLSDFRGLDQATEVLPYRSDIQTDTTYDPNAFWWHGQLATIQGGVMRALDGHGGLGRTLAKGFPAHVLRVSSDSSGNHLLLQAGSPVVEDDNGTIVATAATYRWDRGVLAEVTGPSYSITGIVTTNLFQPGW